MVNRLYQLIDLLEGSETMELFQGGGMSLSVSPPDDNGHHDLAFDLPCRFGHDECSDSWNGPCTLPTDELRAEAELQAEAARLITQANIIKDAS
jgi:hypothetical protein